MMNEDWTTIPCPCRFVDRESGRPVLEVSVDEGAAPLLRLFNSDGKVAVAMGTSGPGYAEVAFLELCDGEGRALVSIMDLSGEEGAVLLSYPDPHVPGVVQHRVKIRGGRDAGEVEVIRGEGEHAAKLTARQEGG